MISAFHGIEVGKKGLFGNQTGIDTVGHNLSNMATDGYSRQKVNMKTAHPIYDPSASRPESAGQIGTGVEVENIERVRDRAIDDRINYEKGGFGRWNVREDFLHQIEMTFNEPGQPNLRTILDNYYESWRQVSADPSERASREQLVERANILTDTVNHYYRSLKDLRDNSELMIQQRVTQINQSASEIASLNEQIMKSEALGDNPNDLYDRRDKLVDQLAEYVNIRVERNNKHEVIVYLGSENLIQGNQYNSIHAVGNPSNEGYADIRWSSGRMVKLGGGELAGLVEARDEDIGYAIHQIDTMTASVVDATNEIHRDGFGLNGKTDQNFFKEITLSPFANGNYDFNMDGTADGTAVYRISGSESVDFETASTGSGFINFGPSEPGGEDVVIAYQTGDSVGKVIEKINRSDAGVSAYLNHKGQLSFKSKSSFGKDFPELVIRHIEDSGNFLVGLTGMLNESGNQGAFDYQNLNAAAVLNVPGENVALTPQNHPSTWMTVDDRVRADADLIAAAGGIDTTGDTNPDQLNGFGDNRNALNIAGLQYQPYMIDKQKNAGDFIQTFVGEFGTRSESAKTNKDKNEAVVQSLSQLREQVSGVNVDEELTKMLTYQHGYNASARLINVMDGMIETVLRMGV